MMTPETFAKAIASIEQNYGLKLDGRLVRIRLDAIQCGKGWIGTRPGCKHGKKSATSPDPSPVAATPDKAKRIRKSKAVKEVARESPKTPSRSPKAQDLTSNKTSRDVLDKPFGQILRTPLKFMRPGSGPESKDKATPEFITAMEGKKNIQPIMVKETKPDSYEIVSGHKTADAMKKAGSDFAQVIIMDKSMEKQWRMETSKGK